MIRAAAVFLMVFIAIPLHGISFRTSGGFGLQTVDLESEQTQQRCASYSLGIDIPLTDALAVGTAWTYYQAGNAPLSGNTVLRGYSAQSLQLFIDHTLLRHQSLQMGYELFADAWYARYANTQRVFFFLAGGAAPYGEVSLNPHDTVFLRLSAPVRYARRRDVDRQISAAAEITLRMQVRRPHADP